MANNPKREEEIKNLIRDRFFKDYDATPIIGDIDFAVTTRQSNQIKLFDREYFLWAEAKAGTKADIYASFVQLIITIGKAHTIERYLPPRFIGAFDEEKIAFIEFHNIMDVFYQNDFNWNVTPSNHETKEFRMLYQRLSEKLKERIVLFYYDKDRKELNTFIRSNFKIGEQDIRGINITRNNFMFVFQRWIQEVKPSIAVKWEDAPEASVADFFFADLISRNDYTLRGELAVVLRGDHYKILQDFLRGGTPMFSEASFNDNMAAYRSFWNKYNRPPRHEYLDIIMQRRDLLIPQNLRQYKGAYFTPPQWVQKSQEYIAAELGEDWQQNYYVWDCCAGTGNLLYGLSEPYRIWASTLDDADVQVMKERIKEKSLNLLPRHIFQFDFLNDTFDKLPETLRQIIIDPEQRKKLVIYINPPYAEAGNRNVIAGSEDSQKKKIAVKHLTYQKYLDKIGIAGRELFAQFIVRIYDEIPSSVLAQFSKLKILQAPNFRGFRKFYQAKLGSSFIVPANTFDNVNGRFPIGFFIWHLNEKEVFSHTESDVFDSNGIFIRKKHIFALDGEQSINDWIIETRKRDVKIQLGYMSCRSHDISNVNYNFIMNDKNQMKSPRGSWITDKNLTECSIYIAVCHSTVENLKDESRWLNDRDQFLYPNDGWKSDFEFQCDCLVYTLFSNFNNIQSRYGINHWIPFSEEEVGAQDSFSSHFMHDFIVGNISNDNKGRQLSISSNIVPKAQNGPVVFSTKAQAVMDAGRELWKYYHKQPNANPDASFYDIRLHFQGTKITTKGKEQMRSDSTDEQYTLLIANLREHMKVLSKKIEPKVYEYGFLK